VSAESAEGRDPEEDTAAGKPGDATGENLAEAYERRTEQLHETRSALAEAVHTLRLEVAQRREEAMAFRGHNDTLTQEVMWLREVRKLLTEENQRLTEHAARLDQQLVETRSALDAVKNMKVVRWTRLPRGWIYQLLRRR
jgi:uncharacterized coiled-coil DUF342 family protein